MELFNLLECFLNLLACFPLHGRHSYEHGMAVKTSIIKNEERSIRFIPTAIVMAAVFGIGVLTSGERAYALVVNEQLNQVNNGNVIIDPAQIIDVSANNGLGP